MEQPDIYRPDSDFQEENVQNPPPQGYGPMMDQEGTAQTTAEESKASALFQSGASAVQKAYEQTQEALTALNYHPDELLLPFRAFSSSQPTRLMHSLLPLHRISLIIIYGLSVLLGSTAWTLSFKGLFLDFFNLLGAIAGGFRISSWSIFGSLLLVHILGIAAFFGLWYLVDILLKGQSYVAKLLDVVAKAFIPYLAASILAFILSFFLPTVATLLLGLGLFMAFLLAILYYDTDTVERPGLNKFWVFTLFYVGISILMVILLRFVLLPQFISAFH